MARFDLDLADLHRYVPEVAEPDDFDEFWARTLAEARAVTTAPTFTPIASPLVTVDVFDVRFPGYGGAPIAGWLLLPKDRSGPLPTVVEFNGYNGGRGMPHERLGWVNCGYAWFFMDTRGQGSLWGTPGITPDPEGSGPSVPGFMTQGIESPDTYYYRRVYTDAARAVDAVRTLDAVDPDRIAVCGGSQGGGLALAAAGLSEGLAGVLPDVPFLCHFERAVGMTDSDPYHEVVRYLAVHRDKVDRTFRTLSYFDGVNLAKRATAPSLFSVGLMDPIVRRRRCSPPTTTTPARARSRSTRSTATRAARACTGSSRWTGSAAPWETCLPDLTGWRSDRAAWPPTRMTESLT